jgi:uncharacterized protein (DUF1810 family)
VRFCRGSPAASHFSCFAKKSNPKKATPVRRHYVVSSTVRKQAGLRNSTWQGVHITPCCGTQTVLALNHRCLRTVFGGAQGAQLAWHAKQMTGKEFVYINEWFLLVNCELCIYNVTVMRGCG